MRVSSFLIVIEGPVGRIMRAAAQAKDDKREFVAADVTRTMARAVVTVTTRRDGTLSASRSAVPMAGVPGVWVPSDTTADYLQPIPSLDNTYRVDVVIRSKSGSDAPALTPIERMVFLRSAATRATGQKPTAYPFSFPGNDIIAGFDLAAFRGLPAGDVDVVAFMTDTGERRCKISEKDRAKIR